MAAAESAEDCTSGHLQSCRLADIWQPGLQAGGARRVLLLLPLSQFSQFSSNLDCIYLGATFLAYQAVSLKDVPAAPSLEGCGQGHEDLNMRLIYGIIPSGLLVPHY